jgi:hypothetical protein
MWNIKHRLHLDLVVLLETWPPTPSCSTQCKLMQTREWYVGLPMWFSLYGFKVGAREGTLIQKYTH